MSRISAPSEGHPCRLLGAGPCGRSPPALHGRRFLSLRLPVWPRMSRVLLCLRFPLPPFWGRRWAGRFYSRRGSAQGCFQARDRHWQASAPRPLAWRQLQRAPPRMRQDSLRPHRRNLHVPAYLLDSTNNYDRHRPCN